jgi:hypothetical protein
MLLVFNEDPFLPSQDLKNINGIVLCIAHPQMLDIATNNRGMMKHFEKLTFDLFKTVSQFI